MFCALRASLASDQRSRKAVYAVFKLPSYLQTTQIPRYGNCIVFGAMIKWCMASGMASSFRSWNNRCSSSIDSFLFKYCPFYPFFFVRIFFFSCMSRDVNHAFCVVYKILGEVTLFYRTYFFDCGVGGVVGCRSGFYIRKHAMGQTLNLSLLLDEPLCQPRHPVGYNTTLSVIVLFYRMFFTWIDHITTHMHIRG